MKKNQIKRIKIYCGAFYKNILGFQLDFRMISIDDRRQAQNNSIRVINHWINRRIFDDW